LVTVDGLQKRERHHRPLLNEVLIQIDGAEQMKVLAAIRIALSLRSDDPHPHCTRSFKF
jgi:hypothetical protein